MLLVRKHREETLDAMGSLGLSKLSFPLTDTYETPNFYILAISVIMFHWTKYNYLQAMFRIRNTETLIQDQFCNAHDVTLQFQQKKDQILN